MTNPASLIEALHGKERSLTTELACKRLLSLTTRHPMSDEPEGGAGVDIIRRDSEGGLTEYNWAEHCGGWWDGYGSYAWEEIRRDFPSDEWCYLPRRVTT